VDSRVHTGAVNPEPFTLGSMMPSPPRRRRVWLVPLLVGAALLLVGAGVVVGVLLAGGHKATPAAASSTVTVATTAPVVPSPATSTTSAGSTVDPDTAQACDLNEKMRNSGADLVTQGDTIGRIQQLTANSTFDVRFAGNMLKDRYDLAAAARRTGGDDQLSTSLNLTTASINLSTACLKAGWRTGS